MEERNQHINTGDYMVGLDIGTTKISVMIGRKNQYGKLEILGTGRAVSNGVARGIVANIDKTVDSIKEAITEAKKKSGIEIDEVFVGIAGQHIKSLQHRGELVRDNIEIEIEKADIDKLKSNMFKLITIPGEEVIHVIPQEYTVDGEDGIQDPKGMAGVKLEANFHVITAQVGAVRNIIRCVEKAGLTPKELVLEPFASAVATLDEDELREGVALVDIGGRTTDVAIFLDNIIRHTAVIPFGGNVITKDIKTGLSILEKQAELLKIKFGSAMYTEDQENVMVSIPGLRGREPKEIAVKNLSEIIGAQPIKGRHINMESLYEYGSRRGFWRIHKLFQEKKIPITIFGVGMALEKNPDICNAIKDAGYEVASHGWRWIDYQNIKKSEEKKHMKLAIQTHKRIFGDRPSGWYTGRCSPNTRDLVMEDGGFLYDSDSYSDDLPYWETRGKKKQLIIPYTLDNNDMRFATNQGFNTGDHFFTYLKDSFDALYEEGKTNPKMMSVGLHCRIVGKPGRIQALKKFLNYIKKHKNVWVCKRVDIAKHWIKNYSK